MDWLHAPLPGLADYLPRPRAWVAVLTPCAATGAAIGMMYLFLSFLVEDSGYMARAAFVMDHLMQALGLPGKSFVPLIVGSVVTYRR
ncbi:nucleoside recognition domain-containing protein [Shigella flexneri]